MKELIENTLKSVGIEVNYLERIGDEYPQLVYTFNEYPNSSGDNREETALYDIYLNLYIESGIESDIDSTVNKIKSELEKAHFKKVAINSPIKFEEVNYYQITMNYKKIM